jgi:hypothetical protein
LLQNVASADNLQIVADSSKSLSEKASGTQAELWRKNEAELKRNFAPTKGNQNV